MNTETMLAHILPGREEVIKALVRLVVESSAPATLYELRGADPSRLATNRTGGGTRAGERTRCRSRGATAALSLWSSTALARSGAPTFRADQRGPDPAGAPSRLPVFGMCCNELSTGSS